MAVRACPTARASVPQRIGDWLGAVDDGGLAQVVNALQGSFKEIAGQLAHAPIDGLSGAAGQVNVQGEVQQSMDVIANELVCAALYSCPLVRALVSEEAAEPELLSQGKYLVAFDPLDGSSNVACSIPTGSIFAIWDIGEHAVSGGAGGVAPLLLPRGSQQVAAGYALFSSACHLVLTLGRGTHGFTLEPGGDFYLTHPHMRCPPRGPYYSLNEGRSADWPPSLRRYIDNVKNDRRMSSRYVCSLVADMHRTLLLGGWAGNPRAHLRTLYEAFPMAFLTEQAGGSATDGKGRILDLEPASFHARTPLFAGSCDDIAELLTYGDVRQTGDNWRYNS